MNRNDIHNAVLEYLDLIENGRAGPEENLQSLELVLDKLALAHNFIDFQFDEKGYSEAQAIDYNRLRQLAGRLFPILATIICLMASPKGWPNQKSSSGMQ